MKSVITLIVDHNKPVDRLADLIAQRAYTLPGVDDVNVHADVCESDVISLPVIDPDALQDFHSRVFKEAGVRS